MPGVSANAAPVMALKRTVFRYVLVWFVKCRYDSHVPLMHRCHNPALFCVVLVPSVQVCTVQFGPRIAISANANEMNKMAKTKTSAFRERIA